MSAQVGDLRVAVIGAGPAGLYAADALLNRADLPGVRVDVIDRLPAPFGLVRYGVAPDHLSIRSVRDTLDRIFDQPGIRFLGGVAVGDGSDEVSLEAVRAAYDAVILSYGAATDRPLGIPGEDLPGSISATEFVRWYTGHPDSEPDEFTRLLSQSHRVAVIGVGNVAVDVARILAKTRGELEHTDMPEHVLTALDGSGINEIHIVGRRGPVEASWTTKELRELGELNDAAVIVDPADLRLGASSEALAAQSKVAARNLAVVEEWAGRAHRATPRTIQLRFFSKPVRIEGGDDGVEALVVERTELTETGTVVGTGHIERIPVDVVIRSVGYRGVSLPGVPFDHDRGVIAHEQGRVMGPQGAIPGLYTAGWIKRGPTGIIGTNKKDAVETVTTLIDDLTAGLIPRRQHDEDLFAGDSAHIVDVAGWRRIDAAEKALGHTYSRERTTIHQRDVAMSIGAHTG
jgi:ferredoxin--NADP+ reductase